MVLIPVCLSVYLKANEISKSMESGTTVISKDNSTNFLLLLLPHEAFGNLLIGLKIY